MEKTNDNTKNIDYDVASEEVANFIDELIVNRLIEKIEQQKESVDNTANKLSQQIERSVSGIEEDLKGGNQKAGKLLKLLMENPVDTDVLDCEEEYLQFDLVKHSTWEKQQIAALIQRPEFNCNPIFERIASECNRIKGDIIKEIAERLIAESLGQKDKTQEIIKVLLNQKKGDSEIQSDEYYSFDIVDKVNYLEKRIDEIAVNLSILGKLLNTTKDEQSLFKEKMLSILIRDDNDNVPNYFNEMCESIKQRINTSDSDLEIKISAVEQTQLNCQKAISELESKCDNSNENIQTKIENILAKLEELSRYENETLRKTKKKIYIFGGVIIIIQIISILLPYFI